MQISEKPEVPIYASYGSVWNALTCYTSLEITFMRSKAFSRKNPKLPIMWYFSVLEVGLISKASPKCVTTLM